MTQPKKAGRPKAANGFSKRLPLYDNEEGLGLLSELARRRGLSSAALIRSLIREEAQRKGLLGGQTEENKPA